MIDYWGKTDKEKKTWHPLVAHSLDTAAVARVWLESNEGLCEILQEKMDVSDVELFSLVEFFAAIHDMGKFDVRFQSKASFLSADIYHQRLKDTSNNMFPHGAYSDYYAYPFLREYVKESEEQNLVDWLSQVAMHHGYFASTEKCTDRDFPKDRKARCQFLEFMIDFFDPPLHRLPKPFPFFSGLCSVSDWLASGYFQFRDREITEAEYAESYYSHAKKMATDILYKVGIVSCGIYEGGMKAICGFKPRSTQVVMDRLVPEQSLTIIEDGAGEGKTEGAIAYVTKQIAAGYSAGIRFFLPTRATANSMFKRIDALRQEITPLSKSTIAHSKSHLFLNENGNKSKEKEWGYQSRKRAFLSQYGVSTIDQGLLSTLPVRHWFVRGWGMAYGTLVLDEVHDYDEYMFELFKTMIRRQRECGGSVVILSATLSEKRREEILSVWTGEKLSDSYKKNPLWKSYPLVTHVGRDNKIRMEKPKSKPTCRKIRLEKVQSGKMVISDRLLKKAVKRARKGQKVAIVCNLVDDAQEVYERLRCKYKDVDIFHSRYSLEDRHRIENDALSKYGNKSLERDNGEGCIVVATQVIQESLDLDFDWMITQMCPIDLLFQRLGRLFRDMTRKRDYPIECTVLLPLRKDKDKGVYAFWGNHHLIYPNVRVMWRTLEYLSHRKQLCTPSCFRDAIYSVYESEGYGNKEPAWVERVYKEKYKPHIRKIVDKADKLSNSLNIIPEEVDESILTRDSEPGFEITLFRDKGVLINGTVLDGMKENEVAYQREMNTVRVPANWGSKLGLEDGVYEADLYMNYNGKEWEYYVPDGKTLWLYDSTFGMRKMDLK